MPDAERRYERLDLLARGHELLSNDVDSVPIYQHGWARPCLGLGDDQSACSFLSWEETQVHT